MIRAATRPGSGATARSPAREGAGPDPWQTPFPYSGTTGAPVEDLPVIDLTER